MKELIWPGATLEELRQRRDLAVSDGNLALAFKVAYEIDKLRAGEPRKKRATDEKKHLLHFLSGPKAKSRKR